MKINKGAFRYPGSKSRLSIRESILSFFPSGIKEYREPFVGSGGLYFSQNTYEKRWINDLDEGLISVYYSLITNPSGFINSCREIPCPIEHKGEDLEPMLSAKFDELLSGPMNPLRYFFLNRTCWGGRVRAGLTYFTYPGGWNITRSNDYLERVAKYISCTRVSSFDYSVLLSEPGDGVFIYLDPPYMNDTERPGTSKFYDNSFEVEDHEILANRLKDCDHRWCLSYDDHPEIRRLYQGYNIYNLSWTYNVPSSNRPKGDELIITNYIPDKVNQQGIVNE